MSRLLRGRYEKEMDSRQEKLGSWRPRRGQGWGALVVVVEEWVAQGAWSQQREGERHRCERTLSLC